MEKIKDFIYNISDILLSLLIVLVMAFFFYKNLSVFFGNEINIPGKSFVEKKIAWIRGDDLKEPVEIKKEITDGDNSNSTNLSEGGASGSMNLSDEGDSNSMSLSDENSKDGFSAESEDKISKNPKSEPEQTPSVDESVKNQDDEKVNPVPENKPYTKSFSENADNKNIQDLKNTQNLQNTNSESSSLNLSIPDMSTIDKVALILFQNGVIDSSDGFVNYLVENKLDTRVMSGNFNFRKNMSYEDVSNIICHK